MNTGIRKSISIYRCFDNLADVLTVISSYTFSYIMI